MVQKFRESLQISIKVNLNFCDSILSRPFSPSMLYSPLRDMRSNYFMNKIEVNHESHENIVPRKFGAIRYYYMTESCSHNYTTGSCKIMFHTLHLLISIDPRMNRHCCPLVAACPVLSKVGQTMQRKLPVCAKSPKLEWESSCSSCILFVWVCMKVSSVT